MKKEDSKAKDYLIRANSRFYKRKMPKLMKDVQNKLMGMSNPGGGSVQLNGEVFEERRSTEKQSQHSKLRNMVKKKNKVGKGKGQSPTAGGK